MTINSTPSHRKPPNNAKSRSKSLTTVPYKENQPDLSTLSSDFFNKIGTKRTLRLTISMSAIAPTADISMSAFA